MRTRLDFRQADIQTGRTEGLREGLTVGRSEGRTVGRTEGRTEVISVLEQMMQQDGQITKDKLESFIKRMEEEDEKKQ